MGLIERVSDLLTRCFKCDPGPPIMYRQYKALKQGQALGRIFKALGRLIILKGIFTLGQGFRAVTGFLGAFYLILTIIDRVDA